MKITQIGIMGSAADLGYQQNAIQQASKVGEMIANGGYNLIYGAEKDSDSLPAIAARSCKKAGGTTTGITYGKQKNIRGNMLSYTDTIICTGMERGGGREYILVSSCDAIITIGGGSGTLNEITIAYQKKIPIVCIQNTGGRSDKLANTYIDERYQVDSERWICKGVNSAEEALQYLKNIQKSV